MMRCYLFILLYGTVVAGDSAIQQGALVYNQNCTRCHNARPAQEFSDREWSIIVPHMRQRAHLTGKEAAAMLQFLQASNLDTPHVQAPASNKAFSGEELVAKFGCLGCHKVGQQGGTIGPNLNDALERKGEAYIHKKIANPRFDNPASAMPQFPLSAEESQALITYLKHNQHP